MSDDEQRLWGIDKLNVPRSEIPAVTHVDYSARIQTVRRDVAPLYWDILDAFNRRTGCPVVVNTSFNVRGEPIVLTPRCYRCFMRTEMDTLVLEDFVLEKTAQPPLQDTTDWRKEFALDYGVPADPVRRPVLGATARTRILEFNFATGTWLDRFSQGHGMYVRL